VACNWWRIIGDAQVVSNQTRTPCLHYVWNWIGSKYAFVQTRVVEVRSICSLYCCVLLLICCRVKSITELCLQNIVSVYENVVETGSTQKKPLSKKWPSEGHRRGKAWKKWREDDLLTVDDISAIVKAVVDSLPDASYSKNKLERFKWWRWWHSSTTKR